MGHDSPCKRIDFWDEDNLSLSLFPYRPVCRGRNDEATRLVLGFKNFEHEYLDEAVRHAHDAFRKFAERWTGDFGCRYIVPVPRHTANQVSLSSKVLCGVLSDMFPWLEYRERLLFRRTSVPQAHMARPWKRPTPTEHFESLACRDADLVVGAGIILFDDVRTSGNTSQGCRWRLKQDTRCGEVIRVFLGRTEA